MKKYNLDEVEKFIKKLSVDGELGILHKDTEEESPWEQQKVNYAVEGTDFLKSINIVRADMFILRKVGFQIKGLII